ncbi:PREDICTED: pentatricopeptide repeat-containing protein ELI1, chloroplastic-like [Fragaria vesca subsp. vesca]|uniref:pentatricopeptide repeat-containing protein ELI1, chloroplastic-like n=1 Tax=Fragaria vesca subsp. vesca TaxID=101020 RepID=UPI0002C3224F|nr:PREDICTED: pentatricopeptide repeat-containing protein ELI1, chloroplastic-like [Fragaria vesca subsp. vesca]
MFHRRLSYAKTIGNLVNQGQNSQAIALFRLVRENGFEVTEFLLSAILRACGRVSALKQGKQLHCMAIKHGFNHDTILMTSLLDLYCKCNEIKDARKVFDEMPQRDVIANNCMISGLCWSRLTLEAIGLFNNMSKRDVGSWNSLISGLAQNSEGRAGLALFEEMRVEGAEVDVLTMVSVVSICADLAALRNGREVHCLVMKYGFELYLPVGNAVVDMYAKCGCMENAWLCFRSMPMKNVVSWTALIAGYGKQGQGVEALKAFDAMEIGGVWPNSITFLGALYACSHAGLVQEGWRIFNMMVSKYSIAPTMEHYTCMVDLLARSGCFNEAYSFIKRMPIKPDPKLLTAFLSSCYSYKKLELGKIVGKKLIESEPEEAGAYMLLSNFYGIVGDLASVAKVRRLMLDRGIRKEKASTWIEINKTVHSFQSGDRSHPLSEDMYSYLQHLFRKLKINGYVPNTSMVMQNVDEQTKEVIVLGHSEKLAIAFGLISTPPGTRILIVKNLRMCTDCHVVTGLISKIEGREIVARDSSRFHHFKDGLCSCGNHW